MKSKLKRDWFKVHSLNSKPKFFISWTAIPGHINFIVGRLLFDKQNFTPYNSKISRTLNIEPKCYCFWGFKVVFRTILHWGFVFLFVFKKQDVFLGCSQIPVYMQINWWPEMKAEISVLNKTASDKHEVKLKNISKIIWDS